MKNKLIMTIVLVGILLPLNIKALTGSINLNCNSNTIEIDTSTTCTLSGYSNEGISALSAKLSASGNIRILNISTSTIWQGDGLDGNIALYTDSNKLGNFAIATFTVKANSTVGKGTISVSNVNFSDASFNEYSMLGKSLTITVKEAAKPNTNTNTNRNTNTTPKPNTNTNTNTNTTPKPNTNTNTNTTSKPTQQKPVVKSSDATLKSLELSNGTIEFSSDILDYNIEVSNDVESIEIKAKANHNKAKVSLPEDLSLETGINDFEIKVVAEDGTKKIYKLHINRLEKVLSKKSNTNTVFVVILTLFLLGVIALLSAFSVKKNKYN